MYLTDIWGRKWMIVGGLLLLILTLVLFLVKLTVVVVYVGFFLLGFGAGLIVLIPYLLLIESVGPEYRATTSAILNLIDSFSNFYLVVAYQFGKRWWIVFWIDLAVSLLVFFPFLFFVRESPKFYVSVGKHKKAKQVYRFIAKLNKKPMFAN